MWAIRREAVKFLSMCGMELIRQRVYPSSQVYAISDWVLHAPLHGEAGWVGRTACFYIRNGVWYALENLYEAHKNERV